MKMTLLLLMPLMLPLPLVVLVVALMLTTTSTTPTTMMELLLIPLIFVASLPLASFPSSSLSLLHLRPPLALLPLVPLRSYCTRI